MAARHLHQRRRRAALGELHQQVASNAGERLRARSRAPAPVRASRGRPCAPAPRASASPSSLPSLPRRGPTSAVARTSGLASSAAAAAAPPRARRACARAGPPPGSRRRRAAAAGPRWARSRCGPSRAKSSQRAQHHGLRGVIEDQRGDQARAALRRQQVDRRHAPRASSALLSAPNSVSSDPRSTGGRSTRGAQRPLAQGGAEERRGSGRLSSDAQRDPHDAQVAAAAAASTTSPRRRHALRAG